MKRLYRVQSALNSASAHPLTFAISGLFLGFWFGASFVSGGRFDPGLGIGNLLVNGAGLLLMFAACSMSSQSVTRDHELHEKIDRNHKAIHDEVRIHTLAMNGKLDRRVKDLHQRIDELP